MSLSRGKENGVEPIYEVVWPLGRSVSRPVEPASGISDLNGKTVCEMWDWVFRGNEMFPILREELKKKFPGIKIVDYQTMGDTHDNNEREYVANIPSLLKQHGGDVVISGVGA